MRIPRTFEKLREKHGLDMIGKLRVALIFPAIASILFAVKIFTGGWLVAFGIVPRDTNYLIGILTAHFIHLDTAHYISNIVPLLFLSIILVQHGIKRYFIISISIMLCAGLGVWLVGRPYNHIGASGLIYGMFSFLVFHGIYERRAKSLALGVFAFILYSGMCISVFRITNGISWESHILGFASGIFVARILRHISH